MKIEDENIQFYCRQTGRIGLLTQQDEKSEIRSSIQYPVQPDVPDGARAGRIEDKNDQFSCRHTGWIGPVRASGTQITGSRHAQEFSC